MSHPYCHLKLLTPAIAIWLMSHAQLGIANDKTTIGWIEKVQLPDYKLTITAKIDSGAKHSSLNAPDYEIVDKNGQRWVKFSFTTRDGQTARLEAPILREAQIKRKGTKNQQRPVIELNVCVANTLKKVEVNLVDRSNFNYQMLIGRSFLVDSFLIDVSKKHTLKPDCNK